MSSITVENEFDKFKGRVQKNEHFAFSRFGDGELSAIRFCSFTCSEWSLSDNSAFLDALRTSLSPVPNLYFGIPCGCLEATDGFRDYLHTAFKLPQKQLTFATLFTNKMHKRFISELLPCFKSLDIVLVANENADLARLKARGFTVVKHIPVPLNAWQHFEQLWQHLLSYVTENSIRDKLFLFAAGPVSNVLVHRIHTSMPGNFYIDVGSALDYEAGLFASDRNYLSYFSWKSLATCYWDRPTSRWHISCSSREKSRFFRFFLKIVGFLHCLKNGLLDCIAGK